MDIILIRHAPAEPRRDNIADIERHLTEKGKRKYRKLVPQLGKKLERVTKQPITMWSSPANRALETAAIVTEELGIAVAASHDFIYTGDFAAFSEALKKVADDTTLLVVGHEPTLSEWFQQLTAQEITLKKGAMIGVKVDQLTPLAAEFQWQIQP